MATYFHGNTEIQGNGDGLQTLILMNPGYVGYSDIQPQLPPPPPPPTNFVFLSHNSSGSTVNLSHPPPPSQIPHFAASSIPLQSTTSAAAASLQDSHHNQDVSELHGGSVPRVHYNLYNPLVNVGAAREVTRAKQGLSLSLSSHHPTQFGSFTEAPPQPRATLEDIRVSGSASGFSNGVNVLLNSKYLKAAQKLLDEVVNVEREAKNATLSAQEDNRQPKNIGEPSATATGDGESGGPDGEAKGGAELTAAEKHEIQMKKAKLVNMLDEVEQRYKHYHHQMQMVTSWFEQIAGIGSSKTYTALALQTISKQFRCLKDAILGQIRVASKSLGEEDSSGGRIEGSRINYVDHQIRQQKALQQLGMIQHNAWRPQRGLPERSVSVLRAWLFEHFLHPYPKDSDKTMLAKQTGLTRSQVSNWFINARVRLWKPMVEEMYAEEMKEHEEKRSDVKTGKTEQNEISTSKSTASKEKFPGTEIQNKSLISKVDQNVASATSTPTASTSQAEATVRNNAAGFNLIGSSETERIAQGSPKKPRNAGALRSLGSIPSTNMESNPGSVENEHIATKFGNEGQNRDGFTLTGAPTNFRFGSFPIMELGRFGPEQYQAPYSGNGVSLTLGLPHCENLSMSTAHQTFVGRGVEISGANGFDGMNAPASAHTTGAYDNIDVQNPKRFAARLLMSLVKQSWD